MSFDHPDINRDEEDHLFIDGFDAALLGHCDTWDGNECVRRTVYDGEKLLKIMMDSDPCLTYEDAMDYCSFNIEGAYMGKHTPIIVWPHHDD